MTELEVVEAHLRETARRQYLLVSFLGTVTALIGWSVIPEFAWSMAFSAVGIAISLVGLMKVEVMDGNNRIRRIANWIPWWRDPPRRKTSVLDAVEDGDEL